MLGRRADGFHELRSLVAFAGAGDTVELTPQPGLDLDIEGPYGGALEGRNLIVEAAEAVRAEDPSLTLGRFRLVKTLPVAAGLGGGSADAAAALRLIAQANADLLKDESLAGFAPTLGSDVAVCMRSAPACISGRGEIVEPVQGFPRCGVVLANPGVELATGAVYGALNAPPLGSPPQGPTTLDFAGRFESLMAYATDRNNDLEPAARGLAPHVHEVLTTLAALDDARLVRLSGSGATCFAVFETPREALRAATLLAEDQPDWWIAASTLGDPSLG